MRLSWQPGRVSDVIPSRTRNRGKEKNLQLTWRLSTIISEFGACLAQNNIAQEQP